MRRLLVKHRLAHATVAKVSARRIRQIVVNEHVPAAAVDLLKKLRLLKRFAETIGWRKDDPTLRATVEHGGTPRRRWSASEVAAFEARCQWEPGSAPHSRSCCIRGSAAGRSPG